VAALARQAAAANSATEAVADAAARATPEASTEAVAETLTARKRGVASFIEFWTFRFTTFSNETPADKY